LTAKELVARAAGLGIEVLSITDHDTTEALPDAMAEAQLWGLTVVPGVEISTVTGREEIHLLGYFVDIGDAEFQRLLALTREARWERAEKMLGRLATLGLPVEWQRLVEIAGNGSVGRPHVAATLLEAGHVGTWDEAFDLWIGRGRPAYVERYKLTPQEAIQMVRRSGGLPVLAHPFVYSRSGVCRKSMDLQYWLPRLREAGLEGIEVYYPNYPHRVSRRLLDQAIKHGLLPAGGSDFHGGRAGSGLGRVAVPWAAWQGLKRRFWLNQTRTVRQVEAQASRTQDLAAN
jgi:predicted metal-dependent phosphoesterase TrpH